MEKGLKEKTGKSLDQWIGIVKKTKLQKHGQILRYLKEEHGFTHGFANFVALKTLKGDAASHDPAELVANQYSKGKESLKPIYDKLISVTKQFGPDVIITPKKDSVSLIRKKQFALIRPATKSRIDLGLKIKGKPTTDRLEDSGPFGAMCTHRVRLEQLTEVDQELINWLSEAYDKAD